MLDSWTTGTAAAAFVLYVVSAIGRIRSPGCGRSIKLLEAAAWLMLLVHVGFAFHEHHHWSHTAAERHVADETAETVGINFRGGIYFNHAMLIVWGVSMIRRMRRSVSNQKAQPFDRFVDAFVAIMWISATIVFGSAAFRWLGIAGFCWIAWNLGRAKRRPQVQGMPQGQH